MEPHQGEEEPYQMSIQAMIQQIEAQDWTDLEEALETAIPQNPFITTSPPQQYRRYYQLFRLLLDRAETSLRAYVLTSLILRLKSTNYYALMLRSAYFFAQQSNVEAIQREVFFANCLLNINGKEYQLWTYKKQILKRFSHLFGNSSMMLYHNDSEFLDYLLDFDCKNYHVWDYKLWLTQFFKQEEQQIAYSAAILFSENHAKDELMGQLEGLGANVQEIDWRNCYSLWSYRYNLRLAVGNNKQGEQLLKFEQEEVNLMRQWLQEEPNLSNQCGWNYLTGLILQIKTTNKDILHQFLQISLGIFDKTKNRFAGGAAIQLYDELSQKYGEKAQGKPQLIEQLMESDKVRRQYYEYLLENEN